MNNILVSRITDQNFNEGESYECTSAYASGRVVMVDVWCKNKLIPVCVNDPRFEFYFINVTEKSVKNIPYIRGRYNPEYGDAGNASAATRTHPTLTAGTIWNRLGVNIVDADDTK